MVVSGNGEILLGPVTVGGGKRCLSITGDPGKCQAAERKSEGAAVADDGGGWHSLARCEGPLLHRCTEFEVKEQVSGEPPRSAHRI